MELRLFSSALWISSALFILSVVGIYLITGDAANLPVLGDMMDRQHPIERLAPLAILGLLSWVLVVLALRTRIVRREHAAISMFRVFAEQEDLDDYEVGHAGRRAPRAVRRANLIVECRRRDPSSLHETLPAAAALDANDLAASYSSLHVYAWTLPVLGFIGTAGGLASAIGGFKSALNQTAALETAALVSRLSQVVIPGLAAAFQITMLALAASIVTYVGASALRSWDQQALDELDRLSVIFLSRVPQPEAPEAQELLRLLNEISGKMAAALQVPESLLEAARSISAGVERFSAASDSSSRAMENAIAAMVGASRELRQTTSQPYHITITRGESQ